jgi:hypothetical protein
MGITEQVAVYKAHAATSHALVLASDKLEHFLKLNPLCEDISIPVMASALSPVPPIFVDVAIRIDSRVKLPRNARAALSGDQKSDCLSLAADAFGLSDLPTASHKSTKSKSHVFW